MPLDAQLHGELHPDQGCSGTIPPLHRKAVGAYYTPDEVATSLCQWAVRDRTDLLLDPACGDGRFIARHPNSVGIDQDGAAVAEAAQRAPEALIHQADFFAWAAATTMRFDCVVGNPPFIRYQRFAGEARRRALALCAKNGAQFSGLSSAWAPFLVVAASLLKPSGRAAFVVPAEIGHAPYAVPVLEYFVQNFGVVRVVAIRKKLFPDLSEDCWLLYADDFGGSTSEIEFSPMERFDASASLPSARIKLSLAEWRGVWKRRLRPLLMPRRARALYEHAAQSPVVRRFGDVATVGIGYVSGCNDFFHLRPSKAIELALPESLLQPTVRNSRYLDTDCVSSHLVNCWREADEPVLLLNIPKSLKTLPMSIQRYLYGSEGELVRATYKCRHREPWYSVPDVRFPDFFMTYLSGRQVSLVSNEARITCTNALHYVRVKEPRWRACITASWHYPFTQLSCEVEGHPLGGGVLKLEPREASAIILRSNACDDPSDERDITEGIATLQNWRHYESQPSA
jgi:hypothetical protein